MSAAQGGGNGQAPTAAASGDGNGQAPTTPQANNNTAPSGAQNGQAPTATNDFTPPSADEWRRAQQELAEARRDAGKYRDELKKRDDATLSDQQRAERTLSELQTKTLEQELRLQQQALQLAGYRLGGTLGIADVAAALALVQVEHAADVKYAADGTPENIGDLLKAVLKDHPNLAAKPATPPPSSGGATNPGRAAGNGGLTLEQIKAMPMREKVARIEEIKAWEKANVGQQK